jgi:hypothetical protein
MEFLCVGSEVSVELLGVSCLDVVLFLLVNDVFELNVACCAVTTTGVVLDALVVVSVPTHEVDRRQAQSLLTGITLFWIEVFCTSFQILDILSHRCDFRHVFINLLVIFFDDSVLDLESVEQVFLNNFEFEIWLGLKDFQYEEGA